MKSALKTVAKRQQSSVRVLQSLCNDLQLLRTCDHHPQPHPLVNPAQSNGSKYGYGSPQCYRFKSTKNAPKQGLEFNYDVDRLYDTNYLGIPSLPVPTLKDTLNRYLETVEPLVETKEELDYTTQCVNEFSESKLAQSLQFQVEEEAKHSESYPFSYIERHWDNMYYGGRWPLMVHVNPFYLLEDDNSGAYTDYIARTSHFVSSMCRWWRKVVEGNLEPDMERGNPLCMYQYGQLLGTKRIPGLDRDTFVRNPHARHICVNRNGHWYKVDVIAGDGRAIRADSLDALLRRVVEHADKNPVMPEHDVSLLTSGDRTFYARARSRLEGNVPKNAASLKEIDEALFMVILEDAMPGKDLTERSKLLLHGAQGANRWWDKHQVIATQDGMLGMSFEHGCTDGMTWNRMLHEVWHDVKGKDSGFSALPPASDDVAEWPSPLPFELEREDEHAIREAADAASKLVADTDTAAFEFTDFGRNEIKQWKISPDAAVQMAFQIAQRRLNGKNAATYEACAMKNWFHGRTETIRSCTKEASEFVDAFLANDSEVSTDAKRDLLAKAASRHVEVASGAKQAIGPNQGVDRHLFALKNIALERGMQGDKLPSIFTDPTFAKSSTWVLSTSNVTTPFYDLFGFGAVCTHGYGMGYMTLEDSLPVNITSFKSGQTDATGSSAMGKEIQTALRDLKKLF